MYHTERFNAYSHLVGTVLAIFGTVLLLIQAAQGDSILRMVSFAIYGASLIILYGFSTFYHSIWQPKAKGILQKVDHCSIYLLIAGTYTPFALVTLPPAWGWSIFGVSWGLALFGIIQEVTYGRVSPSRWLSLVLYVVMGWLILVAINPLVQNLSNWGLFWLVTGGLAYSIGIYWFINDTKIKHGHGIWHIFVLAGSIAHFICIYFYL
jgi:hemolysin III